jgi:uncharacterized protein (TIGR02145 family)
MKRLFAILTVVLLAANMRAQSPEKISYQAVIRDGDNKLVTTQVGMQISILQGSESGTSVYVETQTPTPNLNGLVTIEIGTGTTTDDFSAINWAVGPYFIKTETAVAAPLTTYTIEGISQILSVPYAFHAKTAETISGGITETDPVFSVWDKTQGISITESQIINLKHFTTSDETDPKVGSNTTNYVSKWNGSSLVSSSIFDNGKLGIGTDNPASALHVAGLLNPTPPSDSYGVHIGSCSSWPSAGLEIVAGPIGAGWIDFHVNGSANGIQDMSCRIFADANSALSFFTGSQGGYGAERLFISNSGNVGIGTTSTPTKLVVDGVITATGGTSANWNTSYGWGNHASAGYLTSYTETDPTVEAITGIVKSNGTIVSAATAGTDYLTPTGSAALLTDFPILNQNTTGNAATATVAEMVTEAAQPNITSLGTLTNLVVNGTTTVPTPVNATDAATKAYVDILLEKIERIESFLGVGVTVTDFDGNTYNAIKIGTQVWMTENLKTTKYNDGTDIPLVTDETAWSNLTTPGYCLYANNIDNFATYGVLYNWHTVNTGILCPTDWHVPSDAEWSVLISYLGGGSVAGGKLKEAGTAHWVTPNAGATNESGFTALPGGYRSYIGTFHYIGEYGVWWSATESNSDIGCNWAMYNFSSIVDYGTPSKLYGFSVRCVRD